MSRQLTVLEKPRITDTNDGQALLVALAALGMPAIPRIPTGHQVIE